MLNLWLRLLLWPFGRLPAVKADAEIRQRMHRTGDEDLGVLMRLDSDGIPEVIQGGKYLGGIRSYVFAAFDGTPIQITREVVDDDMLPWMAIWPPNRSESERFSYAREIALIRFHETTPEHRAHLRAVHEERAAEVGLRPGMIAMRRPTIYIRHSSGGQVPQSPVEAPETPAPTPPPHQPGKRRMRTGRK